MQGHTSHLTPSSASPFQPAFPCDSI